MNMKKDADERKRLKEAKKIVERLATERFPKSEIVRVKVAEDVDFEGDDILRVEVVHDSGKKYLLDSNGTVGFAGVLIEELSAIGIKAFPMMSWVSIRDTRIKKKSTSPRRKRAEVAA